MNVRLDEGVPHELRNVLERDHPQHVYITAQREKLTGEAPEFKQLSPRKKDETLLALANARGFKAVITVDKSMRAEQNNDTPLHVVTLDVGSGNQPSFENMQTMIPAIDKALKNIERAIRRGGHPEFSTITASGSL